MDLVVVSHKILRRGPDGSYATDGGFPMQMSAIGDMFDRTTICAPVSEEPARRGDMPLAPPLRVVPLRVPRGTGVRRKLLFATWCVGNGHVLAREIRRADAVHTPIPGDVGTIGIAFAELMHKRLFVRHCGNWLAPRRAAERAWKQYMERCADRRRVMMATGGGNEDPSPGRPVRWIFSTTLTDDERRRIGRRRSIPADRPPRLGIACRQVEAKGTGVAIEALGLLSSVEPKLSLVVIGDGPDRARFEAQANQTGLGDRVDFIGQVDHETVLEVLDSVDVFVFPTTSSEGFPKAVGEALALGLPVVATPVSVLQELLADGAGVLVDEAAPRLVAKAIESVLRDPERYSSTSERALQTATSFTLERWQLLLEAELEAAWGPLRSPESPVGPGTNP